MGFVHATIALALRDESISQDINKIIDRKLKMIRKSQNSNKRKFSVIVDSIKNNEIISNDSKGLSLIHI